MRPWDHMWTMPDLTDYVSIGFNSILRADPVKAREYR
ncbi:uncharacterized protein EKO05_0007953 [Ascochyta rabiei]|nr:uncharacterized protein EKO05_0007953 [Ascochyta rabiei]UPX17609.1 hypothetical protein EKO05_0007953 [Ascochyta rabiei]